MTTHQPDPETLNCSRTPGTIPADEFDQIAQRLGPARMVRRLRRERQRESRPFTLVRPHIHPQNVSLLTPLVERFLKLTHLRERARRTFFDIEVHDHHLTFDRFPKLVRPLRILHITDLHLDMVPQLARITAARLDGLVADICVVTGDIRASLTTPLEEVMALVKECLAPVTCPIYACLGNHDLLNMVVPLEQAGIRVLLNEYEYLSIGGTELVLSGIDDPAIYKAHSLRKAIPAESGGRPVVLLSHSPCTWKRNVAFGVSLVLSGHTHGGQICLPNGTPLFTNDAAPRRFCSGAWSVGATQGYTSRGIGGSSLIARLNCRPEIVTHVISSAGAAA